MLRRYPIGKRRLIAGLVMAGLVVAGIVAATSTPGTDPEPAAAVDEPAAGTRERDGGDDRRERPGHRAAARRHARIARAGAYAAARDGRVAFAIVGPDGRLHGRNEHERFQSASAVKALILAAELQRLAAAGERLDPGTAAELRRMITVSDNDAATSVFARVGPEGLDAIAHRAEMHDFRSSTTWGASAISAADMVAMYADLGHVFPERYRRFGLGLLGSIVPEQGWGIARIGSEQGWSVRFKGGWRPDPNGAVVNQAAELSRDGAERAIAVLTDRQPSIPYGIATVEGVAERLLRG
jgi:beta-lactamase family protein